MRQQNNSVFFLINDHLDMCRNMYRQYVLDLQIGNVISWKKKKKLQFNWLNQMVELTLLNGHSSFGKMFYFGFQCVLISITIWAYIQSIYRILFGKLIEAT